MRNERKEKKFEQFDSLKSAKNKFVRDLKQFAAIENFCLDKFNKWHRVKKRKSKD